MDLLGSRAALLPPRRVPCPAVSATISPQAIEPETPLRASGLPRFRDLRPADQGLDELRASMAAVGWSPQLPAIADETGELIVGHRRMRVARELGIEPRVVRITFGTGDEADAKRMRLAISSNLGSRPFSREERQKIARQLYSRGHWSLAAIAEVLQVSDSTICRDVADTPRQPRRRGRLR